MLYLEELALIDQDYSHSLSGAIEALQASTLRLPVVGGARVCAIFLDVIFILGMLVSVGFLIVALFDLQFYRQMSRT
jgi:type III secretory pathway component EscU